VALRVDDIDLAADRALVERWQAGEHDAFDDLYRRYFGRLTAYCQRRVGDRHVAEEIAQEAFVKALQALPRFGGERRFYPWVTVIASRLCVDHHRRNARVQPSDTIDPGSVDGDHGAHLAFLADVDNLDRALRRLGPRHLEVLELRERHGMTYQEIADHLAVPHSTVEALLFRARKALRREFMAITGERLVAVPVVGGLLARIAAKVSSTKDRLAEAMPSLAQLGAPMAAGAMAVAFTVGPLAPSHHGASGADGVPVFAGGGTGGSAVADPTALPSFDIGATGDGSGSGQTRTDGAPATPPVSKVAGVRMMPSDEASRAADEMPVGASAGPVTVGVTPESVVEDWLPALIDLLEDDDS
jgi:RNA polymerase sigma-70 factor (ECF subfamily)